MTCMKKLTALLVSAALALSLLAGCGGSKALSQVIADLLSGQYNNVTVEVDPALTAALKKAAAAGDTQEEVLAALVENLNLSGGSITFNNLGDGQQGQHGVTLTFQPGSDPDTAARSAFTEWNRVFSSLPDDGSYRAHVSMIETEGGYYIAVDVEVLKAGTPDKDEPDPDYVIQGNTYIVYTAAGLRAWAEAAKANPSTNCTLGDNITLTGTNNWTPIGTEQTPYTGTFDGGDCTISGLSVNGAEYAGLFGCIGESNNKKGKVQNLTLVSPTVSSSDNSCAGAVAGANDGGTVVDCHVTGSGTITGDQAGGVVGWSKGTVTNCSFSGKVESTGDSANAGGVAGYNTGTITACYATGNVTANVTHFAIGGVVGHNYDGSVIGCYSTSSVTSTGSDGIAGGVVGYNSDGGTVTACYATGNVTANGSDTYAGGVVGSNNIAASGYSESTTTACYWSGSVAGDKGIGDGNQADSGEYKENGSNKVSDDTTWAAAATAMNNALTNNGVSWRYELGSSTPPLTLKKTG